MAIYYVKSGGSDAADGLSDANAWATIGKVNSTLAAGDTVRFRQGDTFTGQIYGGVHANTTFESYDPATSLPGAGQAILQNTTPDSVFASPSNDGVTISNLELKTNEATSGSTQNTIIANDGGSICRNWTIKNCLIHQAGGGGIRIGNAGSTGWVIDGCTIRDIGDNGVLDNDSGGGHTLKNSLIHDVGLFNAAQGRHGIYAKGVNWTIGPGNEFYNCPNGQAVSLRKHGAVVVGNAVHDTPNFISFFDNDATPAPQGVSYVYGNRVWNLSSSAFYYDNGLDPNGQPPSVDFVIVNNTFQGVTGTDAGIEFSGVKDQNIVFKNNVVIGFWRGIIGPNVAPSVGKTYVEDYNLFFGQARTAGVAYKWRGTDYSWANYLINSGQEAHGLNVDPLLVSPLFIPPRGSPVIDAGTTSVAAGLAYTRSPDGAPLHYVGAAPDIGAREFVSPVPVMAQVNSLGLQAFVLES